MAQLVVVDDIVIAEPDAHDPLTDRRRPKVREQFWTPRVMEAAANRSTSRIVRSVALSSNAPAGALV